MIENSKASGFTSTAPVIDFLRGGGQTGALIAGYDWASTSLGPIEGWPQSLKTATALLLNTAVPVVMLWGEDGVMIYNDAYSLIAGKRHPGLLGMKVREAWPEVADFNDNVMKVGLSGGTLAYKDQELTLDRKNGPEKGWMNLDYSPVLDESGRPAGVIAIVVETTERVLADRQIAAEQERLTQMFAQAPGFMTMLEGPEHRFVMTNPAYMRVIGHRDVLGKTVAEALPDAAAQGYVALLDRVYKSGEAFVMNDAKYAVQAIPGGPVKERYVDFVFQPIKNTEGDVTGIFVEGSDVTAQRAAEIRKTALLQLGDRLRDISDPADLAYAASEILGQTLGVSRVGYGVIDKVAETITIERDWNAPGVQTLAGVLHFRDYGSYIENLKRGETVVFNDADKDPRTKANAGALKAISAQAVVNMPLLEQGQFVAILYANNATVRRWSDDDLSLMREVADRVHAASERARSDIARRESEEQFRIFAQASPNQIWAGRADGYLDWFNDQVITYSGEELSSLYGQTEWARIVHPDDLAVATEIWTRSLTTGEVYETEFRIRRHDGQYRWFLTRAEPVRASDGSVVRWVGTNTDIHEKRQQTEELAKLNETLEEKVAARTRELMAAEEALRQSQKMEAVGQLTGGIAHDFNNLLAGISGSLELLERRLATGRLAGVERYIEGAQSSARRAAALTQRLLAFSRRQTLDPKAIDINRLIGGMEDLIRRTVGPAIAVEVVGAGGVWTTKVDPSQLENALLNLCINARDAMSPDGGRLTIETANKWLDDRAARERELPPGQYVSLCVTDTGTGMTPGVIAHAFDPFFTTKPLGQGTGLGLSMIYGFVRQSGGQVRIYSEIGKGTTMCLYLPRYVGEVQIDERETLTDTGHGDGQIVLVIDDEPTIRMLVVEVLEESGYKAIEASDGPSGLRILQSNARIDLLISDVGLPGGMNGRQVADAARLTRPDLKVLFISGFAENAVVGNGHLDVGMEVITKPFEMTSLASKIHDSLES